MPGIAWSVLVCLVLGAAPAQESPAPAPADEFHARVVSLYDFEPGTLPRAEMEAKSAQLDTFWSDVEADPATLGPALRRELAREDAPKFLLYDGSMLLLDLGRKAAGEGARVADADAQLALASLARCTLKGIDHADYLRAVHGLAREGRDTTAAALHILDEPEFRAFIEQHALMLGQDYSLLCTLMPTDEAFWLQPALERLKVEQDEKACASLLKLLWYSATEAGDAAIQQVAEDVSRPQAVRDGAGKFLLQSLAIPMKVMGAERAQIAAAVDVPADASVADLKAARRKRMQDNISDEALGDLDKLTLLIRS